MPEREKIFAVLADLDSRLGDAMEKIARSVVNSALDYLERFRKHAETANHRSERQHFEECYRVVFEHFYGNFRLAHYIAPHDAPAVEVSRPGPRPKWSIDLYSSPMMPVKARTKTHYVLQCGHKMPHYGQPPAKHRRCKQCPKQAPEKWKTK